MQSPAVAASGESLTLREGGAAQRDAFVDAELSAGLATLLDPALPAWRAWVASIDHIAVDGTAVEKWLGDFKEWSAQVAAKQAERAARKAAEAEAAEAAGPAEGVAEIGSPAGFRADKAGAEKCSEREEVAGERAGGGAAVAR